MKTLLFGCPFSLLPFLSAGLSDPAALPEQGCQGDWSRGSLSSITALTELIS